MLYVQGGHFKLEISPRFPPAYQHRLIPTVNGLFFSLSASDIANVWFDIKVLFCKGHDTIIIRHLYIIIVSLMPIVKNKRQRRDPLPNLCVQNLVTVIIPPRFLRVQIFIKDIFCFCFLLFSQLRIRSFYMELHCSYLRKNEYFVI